MADQYSSGWQSKTALTIANSASLSDAVDLQGKTLVGLLLSTSWTAAAITFAGSIDGTNYYPVYTKDGEYSIASGNVPTSNGALFALDPAVFASFRYLKARSGTAASAVNQGGARTLTPVVRSI